MIKLKRYPVNNWAPEELIVFDVQNDPLVLYGM